MTMINLIRLIFMKIMPENHKNLPEKTNNEQKESYAKLLGSLGDSSISATQAFLAERDKVQPEEELTAEITTRLKEKMGNK